MDIAQIHAGSYATRIAQVAAAELAGILQAETDFPAAIDIWFDPSRPDSAAEGEEAELAEAVMRHKILEAMGEYVCARRIEVGETLYRYAVDKGLVPDRGHFLALPFEQRQPWETFVSTCRIVYGDLVTAQLAVIDARRRIAAERPAGLKKEDSIFADDDDDDLGAMIPEAVEALRLSAGYHRQHQAELQAERQRLHDLIDMRARFNGADPARFDHDGDGRPGGSRKSATEKAIARQARKPKALSVGEAPVRPPVNRGGRGNKKPK